MKITLMIFVRCVAKEMQEGGQYSAAKTCFSALRGLLNIANNENLNFADLNPALLKDYEHHLLSNERSRNTISLYMRTLQNICNRAACEGAGKTPENLFKGVFTGSDPVAHRAVAPEVLRKIAKAKLEGKDARLGFARALFMLSLYLRGIPFIDLAHLRKCDMKNGIITYRRSKTKRLTCIRVEPCALQIIEHYAPLTKDTPYLLPIIRRQGTASEERRQYESALRLYNKHLSQLSERLKLGIRLTSYVPRHSWATIAHDIGVDVADISAALCHSSEKMTRNYLQSFTPDRLANVNHQVLQVICGSEGENTKKVRQKKGKVPWKIFYSGSL